MMASDSPLGKPTVYPDQYSPKLLHAILRADSRAALDIATEQPFFGVDIWNAWELTWLDSNGRPRAATAEIRVPATSPHIVESKSLKLYLNSLAMSRYESTRDVANLIRRDLGKTIGCDVDVQLSSLAASDGGRTRRLDGECLDALDVVCSSYDVDAGLLAADPDERVEECWYSHLLRSVCPVTGQPDTGSVLVDYAGPRIDSAGLMRYIVSFRKHSDFHEACVERMFVDIVERCAPERLSVYARYQRRGGIDINPFRSSEKMQPDNVRLWRQ